MRSYPMEPNLQLSVATNKHLKVDRNVKGPAFLAPNHPTCRWSTFIYPKTCM